MSDSELYWNSDFWKTRIITKWLRENKLNYYVKNDQRTIVIYPYNKDITISTDSNTIGYFENDKNYIVPFAKCGNKIFNTKEELFSHILLPPQ